MTKSRPTTAPELASSNPGRCATELARWLMVGAFVIAGCTARVGTDDNTQARAADDATATACDARTKPLEASPSPDGALLWAQVGERSNVFIERSGTNVRVGNRDAQIAIYADGTVRSSVAWSDDGRLAIAPPRGQIVASLGPQTMARVRAVIDRARAAPTFTEFVPAAVGMPTDNTTSVISVEGRVSCFVNVLQHESPHYDAFRLVSDVADHLDLVRARRDAGTLSLDNEAIVAPWPFPIGELGSGPTFETLLPSAEAASAVTTRETPRSVFRLAPGEFAVSCRVKGSAPKPGEPVAVSCVRESGVPLVVDSALAAELLANEGRYMRSVGEWLGIELRGPFFELARGRRMLRLSDATVGERVFFALVIPELDLRRQGSIEITSGR